jgi:hypothetical protein
MVLHAFLDNPVDDVRGGNNKGNKDKKDKNFVVLALFALSISRLPSLRGLSFQKSSEIKHS